MWCFQLHCFYFYTLPPSLIFTLVRAAASQFSLTHIAFFSLTHSLLHFVSLSCLYFHWYVVFSLACCSPPSLIVFCGFINSIFAFFGFDRFRLGDFRSLVLFSLSTRGMFSYLYMLRMLFGCLYHRFRVSKFFGRKNFKWS